ncbi:ATPase [Pleomorphomonas diazotrophica]|uniref:ATPase n=1 Tax=Pleomorphomonas diazotrophica TaxID=1166257 RepID=A0A1I4QK06_9HYPH|nr:ATP12 family protein [Pleomorphomonas diazotrophica]PKR90625.1 ATPase [Pleomorphomonas diazotrophica]SFM40025.1 Chaperone required for the assembly of the F1-ATPase [Pleomorphomonas diazotrophica]
MADLFEDLAASFDPVLATERARANVQRLLPKRFYKVVSVEPVDGLHRVLLDGKPVRTPGRHQLAVASLRAACALEAEWAGQGEYVDPMTMPLTRLVNSAIDGVSSEIDAVKDSIAAYAGSDLTCYRAGEPPRLDERQRLAWEPVLDWVRERFGVRPVATIGVMAVTQPRELVTAIRAALPDDAIRLAAIEQITTLTGSVFLALALLEKRLLPDDVWLAAHVDEDWNAELWGVDSEARQRRDFRRADFDAAALLLLD